MQILDASLLVAVGLETPKHLAVPQNQQHLKKRKPPRISGGVNVGGF
jgi:hypothetical protein